MYEVIIPHVKLTRHLELTRISEQLFSKNYCIASMAATTFRADLSYF